MLWRSVITPCLHLANQHNQPQGLERDAKALTEALHRAYGDGADCDARADDPDLDTRAVYEEVRAALLALSLGTAG